MDSLNDKTHTSAENIICGKNSVLEAIRSGREIDKLYIAHGTAYGNIAEITAKCKARKILIKEVSSQKLDFICGNANHQGVAVQMSVYSYCEVSDILAAAEEKGEKPFIIICDEIEDPHNLGAIIRTAEAGGVHGIIIPERRSASVNATVSKAASGALEYMKIARVTNLANTIDFLKDSGVWVYGADMDGKDYRSFDYTSPTAIVIGNEGKGIGRLVETKCDEIVSLPMCGKINSLNASVAAGILTYAVLESRLKNKREN